MVEKSAEDSQNSIDERFDALEKQLAEISRRLDDVEEFVHEELVTDGVWDTVEPEGKGKKTN